MKLIQFKNKLLTLSVGLSIFSSGYSYAQNSADAMANDVLAKDFINLAQKSVPSECLNKNLKRTTVVMHVMALTSVESTDSSGKLKRTECWNEQIQLKLVKSQDQNSLFGGKIVIHVNPAVKAVRWTSRDIEQFGVATVATWEEAVGMNEAAKIQKQLDKNKIYLIELENAAEMKNTTLNDLALVTYTLCAQDYKKGPIYIGSDFHYLYPQASKEEDNYLIRFFELKLQSHVEDLPHVVNNRCAGNRF